MSEPSVEGRLRYLLGKDFMSDEDIEEAFQHTQDLGMTEEQIPQRLLDQRIIQSLTKQLHELRNERKILELHMGIYNEKERIREVRQNTQKEPYWCEECQDWVSD